MTARSASASVSRTTGNKALFLAIEFRFRLRGGRRDHGVDCKKPAEYRLTQAGAISMELSGR
ncbi:hypothetical protein AAC691_06770 [Nguyenibacter vanlangensis]|uniref:Uncharacterized protein n=1 Tax=Nguyenibacter vanlangensis TaxID=1216886 RepID=A0ABZ3D8M8_9PROT